MSNADITLMSNAELRAELQDIRADLNRRARELAELNDNLEHIAQTLLRNLDELLTA